MQSGQSLCEQRPLFAREGNEIEMPFRWPNIVCWLDKDGHQIVQSGQSLCEQRFFKQAAISPPVKRDLNAISLAGR